MRPWLCQVAAIQFYHFKQLNCLSGRFHFCWENCLVRVQVEKVCQEWQAVEGGQYRGWVTLALVPLVLKDCCCCAGSVALPDFKKPFWCLMLDNDRVIQVCSHVMTELNDSSMWAQEKTLLEVGKESTTLGFAVLMSFYRVIIRSVLLPALEPLLYQSRNGLHPVISVFSPCICTHLSHGA